MRTKVIAASILPLAPGVTQLSDTKRAPLAVDGVEPRCVATPETADEAARILAWCADERQAVIPRGGGTRLALGNMPRSYDLALSTRRLDQLVEHEPADLTVTVQAGMPFADLQAALNQRGQFLPLDPAAAAGSTIGGIVASNASGPFRLRHGTARDLVIGTQVATTSGTVARSGGKVVKNVTGYDLNKLYVGSLGTLALIVELTFKVQPLPEHEATLLIRFHDYASAWRTVYKVLRSPFMPWALEMSRIMVEQTLEVGLHVHLAGFRKPLDRAVGDILGFAREQAAIDGSVLDTTSAATVWTSQWSPTGGDTALKLSVPVGEVVWAMDAAEAAAGANGLRAMAWASAGSGVVRVRLDGGPDAAIVAAVRRLRAEAQEHLGWLVVESCSTGIKQEIDVFGDAGASLEIMRRLKGALDPAGVMSPGRFLGRL